MNFRLLALAAAVCVPAFAHVISMSTGQATVLGNRVEYILRMPDYELTAAKDPADLLFAHIVFSSGSERGRLLDKECRHDASASLWICAGNYAFTHPVEQLGVECSFYRATVANHIHVLHAVRGGANDRAILDSSFPSAILRFRPPTTFEKAAGDAAAGAFRICMSVTTIILLLALAMAARGGLAIVATACVFVAAQAMAAHIPGTLPPRFSESVAALGLVWIGTELAIRPGRGGWLAPVFAALFGAFSGMYFSTLLAGSRGSPTFTLLGAALASVALFAIAVTAISLIARFRLHRYLAGALGGVGCVWFAMLACGVP